MVIPLNLAYSATMQLDENFQEYCAKVAQGRLILLEIKSKELASNLRLIDDQCIITGVCDYIRCNCELGSLDMRLVFLGNLVRFNMCLTLRHREMQGNKGYFR
jgi:hypothetical protein